ncbi:MAG TPA: hypothetical protein VG818_05105 [Gemmatimonadaceae bacterium]|jgi:hypothetical protein|nr:hypothetical protein [Gemmatimonadaceae bacterium]
MRVSRLLRKDEVLPAEPIPWTRLTLWGVFALVVIAGLVLYFRYERSIVPLL